MRPKGQLLTEEEVEALRRAIRNSGSTQRELAQFLGIAPGTLSKILSRERRVSAKLYNRLRIYMQTAKLYESRQKNARALIAEALHTFAGMDPEQAAVEAEKLIQEYGLRRRSR